jgi:hypothetical protein
LFEVVNAALTMNMDIYRQSDSQDPDTGAIIKEWNYIKTIPCYAKGIISNSATARAGDRQVFNNKYQTDQVIEVRTLDKLSVREKITNIATEHGDVIWKELDYPTETPTVFEVIGTTPMTDPFGDVLAWNSVLKRSENQQIGI